MNDEIRQGPVLSDARRPLNSEALDRYQGESWSHERAVALMAVEALRAMVEYHVHDETWRQGRRALTMIDASGWKA